MSRSIQITAAINSARKKIDQVFVEVVGPFGEVIAEDCFNLWLERNQAEEDSLKKYIILLAREIPSMQGRKDFVNRAAEFMYVY